MKNQEFLFKSQQGMSSIIFAVAFITILSLIAVGFATLARRDSNEVLDRTLSYQAQYAAESGVNYAIKRIFTDNIQAQSDCDSKNYTTGVNATCITWGKADGDYIKVDNIGDNPKNYKLIPDGGSMDRIKFTWEYNSYSVPSETSNNLPNIDGSSVLKIALANATSRSNKIMYAIASSSGGSTSSIVGDGKSVRASCSGSSCEFTVRDISSNDQYLAISTLGQQIDSLKIEVFDGGGSAVSLKEVQYEIDSNAIANGVTKRLLVRVPVESSSWLPANAVTVDRICKDIKIDGTNDTNISGHNYTSPLFGCPPSSPPATPITPATPVSINGFVAGGSIASSYNISAGSTTIGSGSSSGGGPAVISPIHGNYEMGARLTNLDNINPDRCTWQLFYVGDDKNDWPPIPISGYINSTVCEALEVNGSLPSSDPNYVINPGSVNYFRFGDEDDGYICDLTAPYDTTYCGKSGYYTVEICAYEGATKSKCEFRPVAYRPY